MPVDGKTVNDRPISNDAKGALGAVVVSETGRGKFQQEVVSGRHHLLADEPANVGGLDSGPGSSFSRLSAHARR